VILTTDEERGLDALRRPLLDDLLKIVMRGVDKEDRQRHEVRQRPTLR
jgi:hypothetical protein